MKEQCAQFPGPAKIAEDGPTIGASRRRRIPGIGLPYRPGGADEVGPAQDRPALARAANTSSVPAVVS